jgi:hypothetical protein
MANNQIKAIEILLEHPIYQHFLGPVYDRNNQTCHFDKINYGVLSGGERAAISWAFAIWEDKQPPKQDYQDWPGYLMRDPFEGFGVMQTDLQQIILRAFAYRWGFK